MPSSMQTGQQIPLTLGELRNVGCWAADCAERVLALFEAESPSDSRPRRAILGIREFARGGKRTAQLRSLAMAAHAAAREVGDPAAAAAARAAGLAAAVAYMHPIADAHQSKHALGPAVYAALACELAAAGDARGASRELYWALQHAPAAVREVVRRYPPRSPGRSRLDTLYYELDSSLRRE